MTEVHIVIQSLKDAFQGKPLIKNTKKEDFKRAKNLTIAIQQAGTISGQTTIMFLLEDPDILEGQPGRFIYAEITAGLFEGLKGAFAGAEGRFSDEMKGM
jgi:hypothetical protein